MRTGVSSAICLIVSVLGACASNPPEPAASPGLVPAAVPAEIMRHLDHASGPTGAAIIVFEPDGSVMFEASTGAMTLDDPVYVASASKWIAAAMLMTLVDEGLLDLDAPASQYAPYLTGDKSGITLRQMFSHTSGMNSGHAIDAVPGGSLQSYARQLATLPLENAPGTTLSYGGISMQIGAAIMEDAAGQSFQSLFLERIAEPLGMQGAYFCHPIHCDVASPSAVTNPLVGGGLKISAADYGNFLRMISNDGVFEGRRILSEEAVDALSAIQTNGLKRGSMPEVAKPDWEYALGQWCNEPGAGTCRVLQSAGAFGTYPWIDRERGIFGVFITESLLPLVYDDIVTMRTIAEETYDANSPVVGN